MTSERQRRLAARIKDLYTREHIADIRLRNAERGLRDHLASTAVYPPKVGDLYRAEVDAAKAAIRAIRDERTDVLNAHDWHTANPPDGSLLMVVTKEGDRYVVERRDDPESPVGGTWYRIDDDETPLTYDEATAVDDMSDFGVCATSYPLYTAERVDDLLDLLGVPDLRGYGSEVA